MVYRTRSIGYGAEDRIKYGPWSTGNCTSEEHPVLRIQKWMKSQEHSAQYVLLFYDKLPGDVAAQVKEIDVCLNDVED